MYELIASLIKFGILLANAGIFQLAKAILTEDIYTDGLKMFRC